MYLIPKPQKMVEADGNFILGYESYLVIDRQADSKLDQQVLLFLEKMETYIGFPLEISKGQAKPGDMVLRLDSSYQDQAYELDTMGDQLVVSGSQTGIWYGLQTLLQILKQVGPSLPRLKIEDYPTFKNRGHYLDVTRGRVPKMEWLKEWIDRLAFYKINQFQLYMEHTYLFRDIPELWRDDTPFTAGQIMDLDQYCRVRGIELVPSLASFGHLYKLLSSKDYHHLCELENMENKPFSVLARMRHHTLDATNPQSLDLVKAMLSEYMDLFTSKHFNICADETFDLGKGRAKAKADQVGKDRLYIDFVKEVANFLVEKGRVPMFWGDVIVGFPELLHELPKETICLTWGYAYDQREYEVMKMAEAGAIQYCCPGCCGWNVLINLNQNSYNNIKRMTQYGQKHKAIGLLNTDWGDFLHINHMDFSIPPAIYGAAFAWNTEADSYEEINRQIGAIEYGDQSQDLLAIIDRTKDNIGFSWQSFCYYAEIETGILPQLPAIEEARSYLAKELDQLSDVDVKCANLEEIKRELYQKIKDVSPDNKPKVKAYIIGVEGMRILNLIGKYIACQKGLQAWDHRLDRKQLGHDLDVWFYHYKNLYRKISRESELYRIQNFVNFYGDLLRS